MNSASWLGRMRGAALQWGRVHSAVAGGGRGRKVCWRAGGVGAVWHTAARMEQKRAAGRTGRVAEASTAGPMGTRGVRAPGSAGVGGWWDGRRRSGRAAGGCREAGRLGQTRRQRRCWREMTREDRWGRDSWPGPDGEEDQSSGLAAAAPQACDLRAALAGRNHGGYGQGWRCFRRRTGSREGGGRGTEAQRAWSRGGGDKRLDLRRGLGMEVDGWDGEPPPQRAVWACGYGWSGGGPLVSDGSDGASIQQKHRSRVPGIYRVPCAASVLCILAPLQHRPSTGPRSSRRPPHRCPSPMLPLSRLFSILEQHLLEHDPTRRHTLGGASPDAPSAVTWPVTVAVARHVSARRQRHLISIGRRSTQLLSRSPYLAALAPALPTVVTAAPSSSILLVRTSSCRSPSWEPLLVRPCV